MQKAVKGRKRDVTLPREKQEFEKRAVSVCRRIIQEDFYEKAALLFSGT